MTDRLEERARDQGVVIYRGFVKGYISIFLGNGFTFEAELLEFMIAMEKAHKFR